MSSTFTASNGVVLGKHGLWVSGPSDDVSFHAARIEFYRHLEDERLGRWRWPENPEYVVYPFPGYGDRVRAVHEISGQGLVIYRGGTRDRTTELGYAARAYFAAHPESKPWHGAKQNDIWVLTIAGSTLSPEAYRFADGHFRPVNNPDRAVFSAGSTYITDAEKIWPDEEKQSK